MEQATLLRAKHTTFTYKKFSWRLTAEQTLFLEFTYHLSPDITFTPNVTIHSVTQEMVDKIGKEKLNQYVFTIGMAELFSYWKVSASPKIVVSAGSLTQSQIDFWQKLLLKGMGEFFYQNKLQFSEPDFITISSHNQAQQTESSSEKNDSTINYAQQHTISEPQNKTTRSLTLTSNQPPIITLNLNKKTKILVPVGGGKDSAVSLEILKQQYPIGTAIISTPQASQDIISASGISEENQIRATRLLDSQLGELNSRGYLNGHVPISAYIAFLTLLIADLFEYTHVAISNERSSNEGNVWYCDQEINHQYSKTYEFEHDLFNYVHATFLHPTPHYFSFLRPLYELQIGQLFADFPQYHALFRSCNKGQKQNIWCGSCSKCLFAWTILFPFLGEDRLTTFFGKNLFTDAGLWDISAELLGISTHKPFDCVGTHEESVIAFYLSIQWYKNRSLQLPTLLAKIAKELTTNPSLMIGPTGEADWITRAQLLLNDWNQQHLVPQELADLLKSKVTKNQNWLEQFVKKAIKLNKK